MARIYISVKGEQNGFMEMKEHINIIIGSS